MPTPARRSWMQLMRDRQVLSWSLYDWANSAFATTVMAGFFPIFFKQFWSAGTDANLSTYQLGSANSLASAVLAILSPILGAIADQGSSRKKLLLGFTFLGVVMTGALSMVSSGHWELAIVLYLLASIGFAGSNSFYDALLIVVARPGELNRISALGFSLGYLGGGILFALNVVMTLRPFVFGLRDAAQAVQISFLTVGIWWALFTLPLLLFVKEKPSGHAPGFFKVAGSGFRQLGRTFLEIKSLRNTALFLVAYFFYIDGVNTIVRMAVDYGLALGFPTETLITALLITQFVGFPAALLYSSFAHRVGSKSALLIAILVYVGVNIYAYTMKEAWQFYVLAVIIGFVQGGIQSLSRSVFGQMTPIDRAGEFFGFFNMLGKFSSMVGPLLVGWVSLTTLNSRLSILSIILLFAMGSILLAFVKIDDHAPHPTLEGQP